MKLSALALISIAGWPAVAVAALTPLFEYPFPAAYSGAASEPVIDQSAAHNDAQAYGRDGELMLALSDDVPAGAAVGAKSLDLAAVDGSIRTNATKLLDRTQITAAGGFTMDVWFKGVPVISTATTPPTQKIMDDTGTEFIGLRGGDGDGDGKFREVSIRLSTSANTFFLDEDDGLLMDDWNHVIYSFAVTNAANPAQPVGEVRVNLNGTVRVFANRAMSSNTTYSNFNRPVSIGRHPTNTSEHYLGLIYHPSHYLGLRDPSISVTGNPAGFDITYKGVLQSSLDLMEWNDVTGAVSPYSVLFASGSKGFFRARP